MTTALVDAGYESRQPEPAPAAGQLLLPLENCSTSG